MLKILCFIKSVRGNSRFQITGFVSVLACRDGERTKLLTIASRRKR